MVFVALEARKGNIHAEPSLVSKDFRKTRLGCSTTRHELQELHSDKIGSASPTGHHPRSMSRRPAMQRGVSCNGMSRVSSSSSSLGAHVVLVDGCNEAHGKGLDHYPELLVHWVVVQFPAHSA